VVAVVVIEIMLLGLALVMFLDRRKLAVRETNRLVEHGGLPADPELVEAARQWYVRRQVVLVSGLVVGALVGGAAVLIAKKGWGLALESELDMRLVAFLVAVAAAAGGLASLAHSYKTVRMTRLDGPRTAVLRPRRVGDYLSPIELAIEYGAVLLPLVAVAMGAVVLGSNDHPARGWILVASGVAAVPLWGMGIFLQRKALEVNQQSSGVDELRWQETLRATTLREIASSGLTVCWLLGATVPMSFQWPSDAPGFLSPLATVLFLVSVGMLILSGVVGRSGRVLRRAQQVAG
jgi:hypothetical protein